MNLKDFFKYRLKSNKFNFYIFLELFFIVFITLFLNYLFTNHITFSNSEHFNYILIIILIASLYYGLLSGFVLSVLFLFSGYLLINYFPYNFFIHALIISLIAGEFNFYFKSHIYELEIENKYLLEKLREIGIVTLFTKLSHDNLEKSYLTKPYTLRSIVKEIMFKKTIDDFIHFLAEYFNIESFFIVDKGKIYKYKIEHCDLNDLLIQEMYERNEIVYVNNVSDTKYLAAIPILTYSKEIEKYIVIKKMPFMYYNIENLFAIKFSCNYYFLEREKMFYVKEIKNSKYAKYFSYENLVNILKLVKLREFSNIHTSYVFFEIDKLHSDIFENFTEKSLRILDFYEKIISKNKDIYIIFLPFTAKEGAVMFAERIKSLFEFINEGVFYYIFELENLEKIFLLLKEKNEN